MSENNATRYDRIETTRAIRSMNHEIGPEAMAAMKLFEPFHERPPYEDVRFERDIFYGPDPRNRLDVCVGDGFGAQDGRDVFVFLHGGGFVRGDKALPDSPYHDNVAIWAARNGMVGVNMTYRFAPEHRYPSGIEDVAAAVRWLNENIESFGGDSRRTFLFGSSAGAIHAACYLTHPACTEEPGIAGAILQSGVYDFTILAGNPYFGEYSAKLAEYSPRSRLVESPIPVLYVLPEFDPPLFELDLLALINAYANRANTLPDFIRLTGHNHFTAVASINSPDTDLGDAILGFMDATRG